MKLVVASDRPWSQIHVSLFVSAKEGSMERICSAMTEFTGSYPRLVSLSKEPKGI